MRSSGTTTSQEFHIKQDDKFFSKLLSKEASTANPSFRVYYGDVSGAVPFTWETQPGTPKHALMSDSSSLPPLTPPPAYYHHSRVSKGPNPIRSSSNFLIFRTLLMRIITMNKKNKKMKKMMMKKKNSQRVTLSPPSCSSSSLSSLSWSSSSHSTTTSSFSAGAAVMTTTTTSSSSSSSSFAENQENIKSTGSWTSSFCFGLRKASNGSVKLHQVDNSATAKKTRFSKY